MRLVVRVPSQSKFNECYYHILLQRGTGFSCKNFVFTSVKRNAVIALCAGSCNLLHHPVEATQCNVHRKRRKENQPHMCFI